MLCWACWLHSPLRTHAQAVHCQRIQERDRKKRDREIETRGKKRETARKR